VYQATDKTVEVVIGAADGRVGAINTGANNWDGSAGKPMECELFPRNYGKQKTSNLPDENINSLDSSTYEAKLLDSSGVVGRGDSVAALGIAGVALLDADRTGERIKL